MPELAQLFIGLSPTLGGNYRHLIQIIQGVYCISSGGVTMKNVARWSDIGYRTVQRVFAERIDWLALNLILLQSLWLEGPDPQRYILAVDETVKGKAGRHTYGLGWFYSSIAGKVIRAISYHVVSVVDTKKERSFVLKGSQTVKPDAEKAPKKQPPKTGKGKARKKQAAKGQAPKGQAGRPKGSRNKQNIKEESLLYRSFEELLRTVLPMLAAMGLGVRYVAADGAYGNKTCCIITRELGLRLLSKLNRNTALYLPDQGGYGGKGRHKKYGEKLDYQNIPGKYLATASVDKKGKTQTKTYQIKGVWTKHIPCLLNVVILVKTDLKTLKTGRVVLFSTDLELAAGTIVHFYSQRFQIEFNFRDAKQYFGLADLKNVKEQQLDNAVNLAFFMDNVSLILLEQAKVLWQAEHLGIQDLKAHYRAEKYLRDILNTLELDEKSILNLPQLAAIRQIGAINPAKQAA
jgi:putative transposase